MQYSKFIWIGWLLLVFSCAQENTSSTNSNTTLSVAADSLSMRVDEGLMYYQNKVFTGTSIQYSDTGIKTISITYANGKKEGLYRKWFEDESLAFEAQYLDGKQHGTSKSWWKNGKLRSASNFKNGVVDGIQQQWYKSGAKFKKFSIANGQEEGLQQAWRENGKIYNNYEAKHGRIFGLKRANLCYKLEDENIQLAD